MPRETWIFHTDDTPQDLVLSAFKVACNDNEEMRVARDGDTRMAVATMMVGASEAVAILFRVPHEAVEDETARTYKKIRVVLSNGPSGTTVHIDRNGVPVAGMWDLVSLDKRLHDAGECEDGVCDLDYVPSGTYVLCVEDLM